MTNGDNNRGPILRLFEVRVKKGCVDTLVQNFATTSADVVRSEPGNRGYFFGQEMSVNEEKVVFASVWRDLDAVSEGDLLALIESELMGRLGHHFTQALFAFVLALFYALFQR